MSTWERKHPCKCGQEPVFVRSYNNCGTTAKSVLVEHYRVQCMACSRATRDYLTMTVAWMDWEDGLTSKEPA